MWIMIIPLVSPPSSHQAVLYPFCPCPLLGSQALHHHPPPASSPLLWHPPGLEQDRLPVQAESWGQCCCWPRLERRPDHLLSEKALKIAEEKGQTLVRFRNGKLESTKWMHVLFLSTLYCFIIQCKEMRIRIRTKLACNYNKAHLTGF